MPVYGSAGWQGDRANRGLCGTVDDRRPERQTSARLDNVDGVPRSPGGPPAAGSVDAAG